MRVLAPYSFLFFSLFCLTSSAFSQSSQSTSLEKAPAKSSNSSANLVVPKIKIECTVKSHRGFDLGYMRPQAGDSFKLNLTDLSTVKGMLKFGDSKEKKRFAYIPLSAPLKIQEVTYSQGKKKQWESLRAVAANDYHKVTFDLIRKPGLGSKNSVEGWVLIELNNRITGVAELQGKYFPVP